MYIMDLFGMVWKEERIPVEWRDVLLEPLPKKGDLIQCDNWCGISLLDMMGKLFMKVIQGRMQTVVEDVLPASQCGFRSGRGCVNIIFCAHQLMQKVREYNTRVVCVPKEARHCYCKFDTVLPRWDEGRSHG